MPFGIHAARDPHPAPMPGGMQAAHRSAHRGAHRDASGNRQPGAAEMPCPPWSSLRCRSVVDTSLAPHPRFAPALRTRASHPRFAPAPRTRTPHAHPARAPRTRAPHARPARARRTGATHARCQRYPARRRSSPRLYGRKRIAGGGARGDWTCRARATRSGTHSCHGGGAGRGEARGRPPCQTGWRLRAGRRDGSLPAAVMPTVPAAVRAPCWPRPAVAASGGRPGAAVALTPPL